jgi:hypothetical protein
MEIGLQVLALKHSSELTLVEGGVILPEVVVDGVRAPLDEPGIGDSFLIDRP